MVDLYVALIIAGRRTIDQVPAKFREAVIADGIVQIQVESPDFQTIVAVASNE